MNEQTTAGLFIDGHRTPGNGASFATIDPATGMEFAQVQGASKSDLDAAVTSARQAFASWSRRSGTERGRILLKAGCLLRDRLEELAQLETRDTGKPITEARTVDIPSAADALEFFGGVAASLSGQHIDFGSSFAYTRKEPIGVCAGIGAWNYPLQIACWKLAPALAAGNTMVFKPSELTPMSALALADILTEAGLPPGVFNVVQGKGDVGQALSLHPHVSKVSLTGSVRTGQAVMAGAASSLKSITLELGGKSPLIIFDDAPIDQAVAGAMLANFYTQGEVCSNGTRVFVQDGLYDAFIKALLPRVAAIRIGDPKHSDTQMGALISEAHRDRVLAYIDSGRQDGARLLCGGEIPRWDKPLASLQGGYFVTPAVFSDCSDQMKIVKEEIFGPAMSILRFKTEDEVIERANATDYGLAAGVFTQDLRRAHRVVSYLEAGTCWINTYNITPIEVPFGGVKMSGLGRENGLAALDHYTRIKSVYVEMGSLT